MASKATFDLKLAEVLAFSPSNRLDGSNVDGKPIAGLVLRGGLVGYTKFCDEVAEKGYQGFELS